MPSRERRPDPEPLEVDEIRVVLIGTAVWAVALVGLLLLGQGLDDDVRNRWVGTCAAGIAIGCFGVYYSWRRAAARRAARRR